MIATSSMTPDQWAGHLTSPPDLSSSRTVWPSALLRHWTGTAPDMDQPPLDHHYIVQHLGGPKRVERRRDGVPVVAAVDCGSLTVVPAGTEYRWLTQGPIEFAHLYVSPSVLSQTARRFERASHFSLVERVGARDPLLEGLFGAMLNEIRQPRAPQILYLDSLLETFLLTLLRGYSTVRPRADKPREKLPAFRLARVLEYVEAHIESDMALTDLAVVAGGSVFHFSRAFKNALGDTPYHYVLKRRTERAKQLLTSTDLPLLQVAAACGFHGAEHFSKAFSRLVGVGPARFRSDADWPE